MDSKLYYYRANIGGLSKTNVLREYHLEVYKAKKIIADFWQRNKCEQEYKVALREYGNSLIKTYMAINYAQNLDKNRKRILRSEISDEYYSIYSTICKKAVSNRRMKVSFKIFYISPILWRLILGWYYKKHYTCSGNIKTQLKY